MSARDLLRRTVRAATVIGALGVLRPATARAQISPGPLAKAHAEFEGATNCVKCHGVRREPMSQICLGCHKDIQWMLDQHRGLHAREVRTGKKECASCHPDHAGVGFALIAWTEGSAAKFDHARAGYALEGKHAQTRCEKCHAAEFRSSPAAKLSGRKAGAGWLGLETTCASCHRDDDVHRNSLGAKCEGCHDSRDWKEAVKFDHARSNYPLTGKHADVECAKCHLAAKLGIKPDAKGVRIPLFKPLPFRECSSCHADPHGGRLGTKCAECHVTRGFNVIDKKEFDHGATKYPLEGKHRTVTCDACHGTRMATPNPAFATCGSCHADAHHGEATISGKEADCALCHRVNGFAPSTFSVMQHSASLFPLRGKHALVKCSGCHSTAAASTAALVRQPRAGAARGAPAASSAVAPNVKLRPASARCADCHADTHGGQLAARPDKGSCESCHEEVGWKPSTYAVAKHAGLRLPLEGRHAAIACAACHALSRPGLPAVVRQESLGSAHVLLAVPERECQSCHADPHAGRYTSGGALPLANGCATCHDAKSFRPARLDVETHARFSYALDGAHRAAPCVACHAELKVLTTATSTASTSTLVKSVRGLASLPFTATRATTCGSCHANPHGTQFASRNGGACESCHEAASFAPASRFDHEKDASCSLKGAHAKVACAGCHRLATGGGTGGEGRGIVYKPLSGKCESCHAGRLPRVH